LEEKVTLLEGLINAMSIEKIIAQTSSALNNNPKKFLPTIYKIISKLDDKNQLNASSGDQDNND